MIGIPTDHGISRAKIFRTQEIARSNPKPSITNCHSAVPFSCEKIGYVVMASIHIISLIGS